MYQKFCDSTLKISVAALLFLAFLGQNLGCAHLSTGPTSTGPTGAGDSPNLETYSLQVKGELGSQEVSSYRHISLVKISDDHNGIGQEKTQTTDFEIQSEVLEIQNKYNHSHRIFAVTALNKKGPADLADLAFPDVGETLRYLIQDDGMVLYVQNHSPDSVFYVPSISLPQTPVKVGDTWELYKEWIGDSLGVPYQLHLVTIFKSIVECSNNKRCADLEISGQVQMLGAEEQSVEFDSDIRGHIFFELDKGYIVSSHVQTQEKMMTPISQVQVYSCLGSQNKDKEKQKTESEPTCQLPIM